MKKMVSSLALLAVTIPFCLLASIYSVYGQMAAENLPLNTMLTIQAPNEPVNRKTVPKKILRYCSYESQNVHDYVRVARFQVVPGQKYTLYDCHPALSDGTKIVTYLIGDTPITNDTHSYGRSDGFTRGFVTRAQQPWPIKRGEAASCDLVRHNITIAPQSEHNSLYIVFNFSKPGVSTKVMLKHPADNDDVVAKTGNRSRGSIWKAPFLLTNIPGEAASSVKPPVTPTQPSGTVATPVTPTQPSGTVATPVTPVKPSGTTTGQTRQTPVTSQPLVIGEASTTSANAPVISYNGRVMAYINRGDYDTFRFDFPGGKMRIASEGNLDIVADLWDAKGNRLARDGQDAKKDFLIEKDLPRGTYYIQIRFMYHAGEGPYTLILGDGKGQVYKEAKP